MYTRYFLFIYRGDTNITYLIYLYLYFNRPIMIHLHLIQTISDKEQFQRKGDKYVNPH